MPSRFFSFAAALLLVTGAARAAGLPPPPHTTNHNDETPQCDVAPTPQIGIQELGRERLSERTLDIRVQSLATQSEQHIAVVLPRNYDDSGRSRYPVLYLLHGSSDDQLSYFDNGIEELVGDLPLIVVTPYTGPGNGYIDWYGRVSGTADIAPQWQSHHIHEVLPFIEASFPVRSDRAGRAIAGISMGGGGAMNYAAQYPHLFGSAASLSGAVNVTREYPYYPVLQLGLNASTLATGPNAYCAQGDFILQRVTWERVNSTYLTENLRHTGLWISCGSGPKNAIPLVNLALDPIELEACEQTETLLVQLDKLGIPHTDDFYIGAHIWSYWTTEITKLLPWLMERFSMPLAVPARFDYRSGQDKFSAWGWDFFAWRDVREFVYLRDVSAAGLTVSGSGTLDVYSPRIYEPGSQVELSDGSETKLVVADSEGRIAFRLDLGPSHERQQLDFGDAPDADWVHKTVSLKPLEADGASGRYGGTLSLSPMLLLLPAALRKRRFQNAH